MRALAIVAVSLAAAGCASSPDRISDPRLDNYNNSSITGVLSLPQGLADASCDGIKIVATNPADPTGRAVGHVAVHAGRNHCSYEVSQLPAGTDLTLKVESSTWHCSNGSAPSVTPDAQSVHLQPYETRTQDFNARCG